MGSKYFDTITTVQLFRLFFATGLIVDDVDTDLLMDAMYQLDQLRRRDVPYFDCIHTRADVIPIAHVSAMPCSKPASNVWLMQQHCSLIPGHGVSIMKDVWDEVCNRPEIEYVIGLYSNTNKRSTRIWQAAYEIIGNTDLCDFSQYCMRPDGSLTPVCFPPPIYQRALGFTHILHKHLKFFSRPNGKIPVGGKFYNSILFKVCDETKVTFQQLFS